MLKTWYVCLLWIGLLASCEMPQMPTVNANLTVPLVNEHYDIDRLKKDLENGKDSLKLDIVSDSLLLTINHDEHVQIGDHMDTDPTIDSTDGSISNDLKLRDSSTTTFSLGLLGPTAIDTLHAKNRIIPAFTVPVRSRNVAFSKFTSATIQSGTLVTTVVNNTQARFDSIGVDSIKVVVVDPSNNTTIDSFSIRIAASGGTQVRTKNFSAMTVNTPLSVRISGHSSGSRTAVTVDTSRVVSIKLVADVTGSSITGRFPSQTISKSDSFKTSTNSVIDTAYITSGKMTLNFIKTLPVNATVLFTSSDFDSAGQTLSRSIRVTNSTAPVVLRLNNWRVRPKSASIGNQYLNYHYTFTTDSIASGGTPATISNGQGIKVRAAMDTLKFSRLRAVLARDTVNISRSSQKVDIKHLDSIQIKRAFFEIITDHRIPFPMSMNITITGKRLPGITKTAQVSVMIPAYTSGASRKDTSATTNYTEVADLLSILPDSIVVTGMVLIGDNVVSGAVNREDFINAQINLRAPMVFNLPNDSTRNLVKTKPSLVDIGSKQKHKLYDRLKSVAITGKIRNHFPVPISVQFFIDSSRVDPPTEIRFYDSTSAVKFKYPYTPLLIGKGVTNAGGIVTAAEEVEINYQLDQSEYQRIFNPSIDSVQADIYRGLKVKLLGTGGFVQVSSTDFIDISASIEFEYFIDEHVND